MIDSNVLNRVRNGVCAVGHLSVPLGRPRLHQQDEWRFVKCILVLSCISTVAGQVTHAQGPPKPPWGLDSQNTTWINVPADIRREVGSDLEYDEAEPIKGVAVDLNGDGRNDYLLQSAPSLCGNGGCVYVVCDGATHKKLGQFFGSPLYVRAELAHGYPNIATYSHLSAESGTYTEYTFDGKAYVVISTRTLDGAALDRLLETLRRVPLWRPRP